MTANKNHRPQINKKRSMNSTIKNDRIKSISPHFSQDDFSAVVAP
jgi:hypothetical protein